MAVKFLSDEWVQALRDALHNSDQFKEASQGQTARIQLAVTDVPDGEDIHYYMNFTDGAVDIRSGELPDAEATVTQSYATAEAIAKGDLDDSAAFMQGKIKASGDIMKVMSLTTVFGLIDDASKTIDVEFL